MPSVAIPRIRRNDNSVNGGMTSNTTLLTTYIPPHMDAAARPLNNPISDLFIRLGL